MRGADEPLRPDCDPSIKFVASNREEQELDLCSLCIQDFERYIQGKHFDRALGRSVHTVCDDQG